MFLTSLSLSLSDMTHLSLQDHDGSSGGASDQDTLPPLPHPGAAPWPMALPYQFPIAHPYNPQPQHDLPQGFPGVGAGSAGSQHSDGEESWDSPAEFSQTQTQREGELVSVNQHNSLGQCNTLS